MGYTLEECIEQTANHLNVSRGVAMLVWSQSGVSPDSIFEDKRRCRRSIEAAFDSMFDVMCDKVAEFLPKELSRKQKVKIILEMLK